MNLFKVYKKYPETKDIIQDRIKTINEKAESVYMESEENDDDYEGEEYELVDKLEDYLLKKEDVSKNITSILDNFEELMDAFIQEGGTKRNDIDIEVIEGLIEKGGLSEEFKKRIFSYSNIAIHCNDKEPYYELLKTVSVKKASTLDEFVIVALLNKEYKESGRVIDIEKGDIRDVAVLSSISNEKFNKLLKNWDNGYKELFCHIDRLVGRDHLSHRGYMAGKDIEYTKRLKCFLSEYIDLDENRRKHLLEYLKNISDLEYGSVISTSEEIRNIDETLLLAIEKHPDKFEEFFYRAVFEDFDEKYFQQIGDKESLKAIEVYNDFCSCLKNSDYKKAKMILEDNELNIFELIGHVRSLNSKYAEYCHRTIAESLTDYAEMEREGKITSRVEKGCKIYELKGQPFFGILHTANANLDDFYTCEEYARKYGEYLTDEDMDRRGQINESSVYSTEREKRSCSAIGNAFLGYVRGNKNRNTIHFAITSIDSSDIIISSNQDLDIKPGEQIEDILNRENNYPADSILDEAEGDCTEILINSFNKDRLPIKFGGIYSFHKAGPTQEEIDTAGRFGIDIIWVDVKEYARQRLEKLMLELSKDINNSEYIIERYWHYRNGNGYELGEAEKEPSEEEILELVRSKGKTITGNHIGKATFPATIEELNLCEEIQADIEEQLIQECTKENCDEVENE